jgi:uncharacterized protein with HEPN domain
MLLLEDMVDSVERITGYSVGMDRGAFLSDRKTIDAIVRNLEIIGEAAARLTDEVRKRDSAIEWRQIIGLRNRIVHEYFGVDAEIVWEIITHDLPKLKSNLQSLISTSYD